MMTDDKIEDANFEQTNEGQKNDWHNDIFPVADEGTMQRKHLKAIGFHPPLGN